MTDLGGAPRRARPPGGRQTIVRVLRIACRIISVSLKDAGPRVAGSAEKDALRRSSTPCESGVLGTCDCVGAHRWEKATTIQGLFPNLQDAASTGVGRPDWPAAFCGAKRMDKIRFLLVLRFPVWRRSVVHVVVNLSRAGEHSACAATSADYLRSIGDRRRRVYRSACGASRPM